MRRALALWLPTILTLAILTGCARAERAGLSVESAWARPSPQAASSSAFYMQIINRATQEEILHEARADHCQVVEIHQTTMDDEHVMHMAPVSDGALTIPPGETVVLEPGGLHLMCVGLLEPLVAGQDLRLTLDFEVAGSVPITVEVRE